MIKIPFEMQVLQNWEEWEEIDTAILQFWEAELGINLEPFKVGDIVTSATFDLANSILTLQYLQDNESVEYNYNIILTVTPVKEEV